MNLGLAITPSGRFVTETAPEHVPPLPGKAAETLAEKFAESNAAGLLALIGAPTPAELPPSLAYWRGFASRFFQAVRQLKDPALDRWDMVPAPGDETLLQWVALAPPMRGLEYLTVELLRASWQSLREVAAATAAAFDGGAEAYLRELNPLWHLLGRVTFHLAENKRDERRPFAFLATYAHRLSGQARLAHLPLSEALKTYAQAQDQHQLDSVLEPVKLAARHSPLARELLDSKAIFAPQAWTIQQAYRFLQETPRIEAAGIVVRVPDWWSARRPPRPQVQVLLGTKPASVVGVDQLLDFNVHIALEGEPLSEKEYRALLAGTEGLVLLRGKWVEVDRQKLQQALDHWKQLQHGHAAGIDFIHGMRLLAGADFKELESADAPIAVWSNITAGDWLKNTLERMRHPQADQGCVPGRDLQATLRPYQAEGVQWLWFMTELGLGACLADDMGLGKTIQIIDLLLQRKRASRKGAASKRPPPSLLVVPASLLGNWRAELARFGPPLNTFFAHRSETSAAELERVAAEPDTALANVDLVVTTYSLVRRQSWLAGRRWSLVMLDEAQAIKNNASAQARSVKQLQGASRIVLTGTPVENHLGDLWSIFDFCCPGLLGTAAQFKKFVKRLNERPDAQAYGGLRQLVRPYILRRMKTDPAIVPDLPQKTEMRTECSLSKKQAVLYEQVVAALAQRLKEAEPKNDIARRGLVLSTLMQLKQICNHPAQYLKRADFRAEESGKFDRLTLLCEPIAERQERALVFTQFQSLTEPLAEFLATIFGRPGLVLHGGTPIGKRAELVRAFQAELGPPFLVISLKAGGSGLNLTAASHVIHFDRWWNPAVENQATDRAFRIGQRRNVLVHKFVCRGTLEERIDATIRDKQAIADQVLSAEPELRLTELNDEELLRFVSLDIERATAEFG
ncbi:MAG TPA: DEAD/DEAH box helicase [Pirellulales bacterium]|nr:DEAD/DEAH box helicase [Pirellulales bacterium]